MTMTYSLWLRCLPELGEKIEEQARRRGVKPAEFVRSALAERIVQLEREDNHMPCSNHTTDPMPEQAR